MRLARFLAAFGLVGLVLLLLPREAHAWTPGTHIFLGQSILSSIGQLPAMVGELIRAFPFDFLYGNIAPDTSFAKKYAPLDRHCHHWHVGQEVYDLAESDALRAFGLGYLCHLAADVVAHNHFVPRQLVVTSSTKSLGHSYWEGRAELHLDADYAAEAREVILLDHRPADAHLERIISPTIFSVKTNRRLFRGMVHLTRHPTYQRGMRAARSVSRWHLSDNVVESHLALAYDYMMDLLAAEGERVRIWDPNGQAAIRRAKAMRRMALVSGGWKDVAHLHETAEHHFGLPAAELVFWPSVADRLLPRAS
ncbi:MAG: zinc dependent phospholipase C family protein [Gemmatimonadales bacterium]